MNLFPKPQRCPVSVFLGKSYLEGGSLLDEEVPAALGLAVLVLGLAGVRAAVGPVESVDEEVAVVVDGVLAAGGDPVGVLPPHELGLGRALGPAPEQGCQMAKFDAFLSLDCARVEGVGGRNPRKERDQILQRSVAEL